MLVVPSDISPSRVQQNLRVPIDPLIKLHIRVRSVIQRHIMRDDKARFCTTRDNKVPQVSIVGLTQISIKKYHIQALSARTLTLHWPVPTVSPFSNNLPGR
jgi:hypothetical protein